MDIGARRTLHYSPLGEEVLEGKRKVDRATKEQCPQGELGNSWEHANESNDSLYTLRKLRSFHAGLPILLPVCLVHPSSLVSSEIGRVFLKSQC